MTNKPQFLPQLILTYRERFAHIIQKASEMTSKPQFPYATDRFMAPLM